MCHESFQEVVSFCLHLEIYEACLLSVWIYVLGIYAKWDIVIAGYAHSVLVFLHKGWAMPSSC